MAKFRNIVVHNYGEIDAAIIVTILKRHLDDFSSYTNVILRMLKTEE